VSGTITATGEYQSRIDGGGYLVLDAANALINVTGSGEEVNLRISPPTIAAGSVTKTGPGRLLLGPGYLATSSLRVAAGTVQPASTTALGHFVANPTVTVSNGATLYLTGGSPYPQTLILHGHGVGGTNGALRVSGANSNKVWAGAVTLATDSTIHVTGSSWVSATVLTLTNTISGAGRFIKEGSGRLEFAGSAANTYSGGTWVRDGYFDLMKPAGVAAIPGNVVIGDGQPGKSPTLHLADSHQIANGFDVTMTNGMFEPNANSESIGTLNGRGAVDVSAGGFLTVSPGSGVTCVFDGGIGNAGSVVKGGNGTLILGGTNTHTGATTINAGTLQVDGEIRSSPLTLNGGRLQGSGKVANVSPNSVGCLVTPGTSPGILTCSNFNASGTGSGLLLIEMAGTTPGAGYDQLDVRGTVNLNGIVLAGALTFPSTLSNQFVLIKNDGADAVVGTFTGWPQNSVLTFNGEQFRLSYTGGDGNDVVLTQISGVFRPVLAIERIPPASVRLLWATNNAAGFGLQSNTNLNTTNWTAVSPPPSLVGTNNVVTNTATGQRLYRLFKP
jgi:autotransporter-associated beta strand protein